ncbi:MAG: FtsW/RodA/SpoVE family cell cycle protein [Puniceicoccales bacterium]|jgi:cell division protein FtsW|nr:FtsW/RodA/SpoVE family cell cycle protein [Puniceicoccales bacterium]
MAIAGDYGRYFSANRRMVLVPCCVLFLHILGLLILSSASLSFEGSNYLLRQCLWLAAALPAGAIALAFPLRRLEGRGKIFYALAAVLLVAVLIPGVGRAVNGSRRWLSLGMVHFQVSEFAKLALVLFLADHLAGLRDRARHPWHGFALPCLWIAALAGLILLEPDYGAAALFLLVGLALLFLNGVPLRPLLLCAALACLLLAIFIARNPVRLSRILSFLDVESTRQTGSYQLWQGMVGLQSGGWWGLGLGNGRQQLFYLPEAHTDFIFPVLAEELGFAMALAVLAAFFIIFFLLWMEIYRIPSPFLFLLAMGMLLFLILQAAINLAVVMGLLPTKGMALPLISYGGSNLVLVYTFLGLLLNCLRTAFFWKEREETDGNFSQEP